MELSEAITIMVVGFIGIIGFWLTCLTYLVFKYEEEYKTEEIDGIIDPEADLDLHVKPAE
jgi:hypothetical protein